MTELYSEIGLQINFLGHVTYAYTLLLGGPVKPMFYVDKQAATNQLESHCVFCEIKSAALEKMVQNRNDTIVCVRRCYDGHMPEIL